MKRMWVLVAESSRARLFETDGGADELHELDDFVHPASRQHDRDLNTDLPGRSFDRAGQGRHAMEEPTSPKAYEAEDFARELARRLEEGRTANRFGRLGLIASPAFLGTLRRHLSAETEKLVAFSLDKNLAHMEAAEIRSHIPQGV